MIMIIGSNDLRSSCRALLLQAHMMKNAVKNTELNVTANGTYTAGEGDYESFTGFNPVKVNVPDSYFDDGYEEGFKAAYKDLTGEDYEGYMPTYSQPDDWETNYTSYYVKNDDGTYTAVTGDTAPDFEAGKYYKNTGDITVPQDVYFGATLTEAGGSVYGTGSRVARIEYIPHSPAYSAGTSQFKLYDADGNLLTTGGIGFSGWKFEIYSWWVEDGYIKIEYYRERNGKATTTVGTNGISVSGFTATGVGG